MSCCKSFGGHFLLKSITLEDPKCDLQFQVDSFGYGFIGKTEMRKSYMLRNGPGINKLMGLTLALAELKIGEVNRLRSCLLL